MYDAVLLLLGGPLPLAIDYPIFTGEAGKKCYRKLRRTGILVHASKETLQKLIASDILLVECRPTELCLGYSQVLTGHVLLCCILI